MMLCNEGTQQFSKLKRVRVRLGLADVESSKSLTGADQLAVFAQLSEPGLPDRTIKSTTAL